MILLYFSLKVADISLSESGHLVPWWLTPHRGWYFLSTILDDYSRYIISWRLTTTMAASDVTDTLEDALKVTRLKHARVTTSRDYCLITAPDTSVVSLNDG